MTQEPFIYLSGAVARLSQRRGEWPDVRHALRGILNNLQLYGERADDEGAGHVPVPATALVRGPRLDRLHAVQVAGHCLKGLEYFGDDDCADWRLSDGDVLHDGRGRVAWRQLCVKVVDLEPLFPVQGPVYEASRIKSTGREEQLKAPATPRERANVIAYLKEHHPDAPPAMTNKVLAIVLHAAGIRGKAGKPIGRNTIRRAIEDAYAQQAA